MRKQSSHSVALLAWLCMSAVALTPNLSWSAEWWLTPAARLGGEYNNNVMLTTTSHPVVHGTLLSPRLDAGARSDIWQVNGGAELVRKNYVGLKGIDRDDEFYTFLSQYKTERATWQLDGNLSHEAILADASPDADTGFSRLKTERRTSGITPSLTWMMTERAQLQLGYQVSSVSYVDGLRLGFSDYMSRSMTANLGYQVSDQDQISATLTYSLFDVPVSSFTSKTTGIQGGITHAFSDSLHATVSAGARRTTSNGAVRQCDTEVLFYFPELGRFEKFCFHFAEVQVSQDQTGYLYNAKLEKQFEVTRLSVTLSRSLTPTGSGTPVQADSREFLLNRSFTSSLSGIISLSSYDTRSDTSNITVTNRTLYQAEPKLRWQPREEWLLDASVRYSSLKRSTDPITATGKAVFLTLRYQGSKMSISR